MAFWSQSSGLGVGREEEEEEADMASQLFRRQPASVFQPLPFPPCKAPSLTSLAQGYSCVRLGSTALSSGLDNGHGHLRGKDSPSFWLRLKRKKEMGTRCFFIVFVTNRKEQ